ncbi:MAG: hypothetical protein IJC10_03820 [Clostridia bacterium]|nr:hypothetical protein [Clostridia bacterium]
MKECVLYDRKCTGCGECDLCDLDKNKRCDNCGKCIETSAESRAIKIDDVIVDL